MKVEILSFSAVSSDDIRVTFAVGDGEHESKESFVISAEAYTEMGLRRGESSTDVYEAVERESEIYSAFKRCVASLAYGACSASMMISKLRAKGISASVAAEAVQRATERGYIDEIEGAKREAQRCLAKLWGESRIRARLFEKRYSKEAIDKALFYLEDSGVDFDESCRRLIDARYETIPDNPEDMRRLMSAVCRQGYSISQIKNACLSLREKKRLDSIYK